MIQNYNGKGEWDVDGGITLKGVMIGLWVRSSCAQVGLIGGFFGARPFLLSGFWDLQFLHQSWCRFESSGTLSRVDWWVVTEVAEDCGAIVGPSSTGSALSFYKSGEWPWQLTDCQLNEYRDWSIRAVQCVPLVWLLDMLEIRCCIFAEIKYSAAERRNPREASCRAQHGYPEA